MVMQAGVALGLARLVGTRFPDWGPHFQTYMVSWEHKAEAGSWTCVTGRITAQPGAVLHVCMASAA